MATPTFDPDAYKETTRQQWQQAAEAWHRWGPALEEWLGGATEHMLDRTGVASGSRVLDVAAGAGGQSLAAARRGATVLATDISDAILEFAAAEARRAGLATVGTHVVDGERLDVEPESFDAVVSRLGLMYFPDKTASLAEQRRALVPGGRVGAIVFAEPEANRFFSVPIAIIRERAALPPAAPGLPGPFSATGIGALLEDAGFADVEVTRVEAPLRLSDAGECVRLERESFGALHAMLAGLSLAERDDVWAEIEEALGEFDGPDGFVGPCKLLVAAATAP
jgi:SAM-dependent methyltransferase